MLGSIAFVIVAVKQHQRELVGESAAGGVEQGNGSALVDGCLATEGPAWVVPAVVQTGIEEVAALRMVGAVERSLLGC